MKNISVCLTRKLRLAQALKNVGIENSAAVTRFTVAGTMTKDDFAYISENMHKTHHHALADAEACAVIAIKIL